MSIRRILIVSIFFSFSAMWLMTGLARAEEEEKVNINTAAIEQLLNLKGIGQTKAEAIVNYRKEHGNFSKIEDLINVAGIGGATFEIIKDKITVEKETAEEKETTEEK